MEFIMNTLLEYLKQASTWRGIIAVVSAFGVSVSPELATEIIASGVGIIGMIEVIRNEHNK